MKCNEITEKLKELNNVDSIVCTKKELEEYIGYGILIENDKKYRTRAGKSIKVKVLKPKNFDFDIDLSDLISNCNEIAKNNKIKHIYCMTQATYEKYKQHNLIVNKADIEYFRVFANELWQVNIL